MLDKLMYYAKRSFYHEEPSYHLAMFYARQIPLIHTPLGTNYYDYLIRCAIYRR